MLPQLGLKPLATWAKPNVSQAEPAKWLPLKMAQLSKRAAMLWLWAAQAMAVALLVPFWTWQLYMDKNYVFASWETSAASHILLISVLHYPTPSILPSKHHIIGCQFLWAIWCEWEIWGWKSACSIDCSIELRNFVRVWRTGLNRISFLTMRHSTREEELQTLQSAAHPCAQCGNVSLQSVQSNLDS